MINERGYKNVQYQSFRTAFLFLVGAVWGCFLGGYLLSDGATSSRIGGGGGRGRMDPVVYRQGKVGMGVR